MYTCAWCGLSRDGSPFATGENWKGVRVPYCSDCVGIVERASRIDELLSRAKAALDAGDNDEAARVVVDLESTLQLLADHLPPQVAASMAVEDAENIIRGKG